MIALKKEQIGTKEACFVNDLLKGLTIIDFTHRLPGPLGANLLAQLGAKVVKIEDSTFKDAFVHGLYADIDESFPVWYRELNNHKEILRFDFKNEDDLAKVRDMICKADALLMGLPPKIEARLGLSRRELTELGRPLAVISMGSGLKCQKGMHDLNALARTGLLSLYTHGKDDAFLAPPFMPMAGIAFGVKVACDLLAAVFKAQREKTAIFHTTYLHETTEEIFFPFWPKILREQGEYLFLHNGLYPCYCIYKLRDGHYAALASVEEKYWKRFCDVFHLDIVPSKRFFNKDKSVFLEVSKKFQEFSKKDMAEILKNEDFCLDIV